MNTAGTSFRNRYMPAAQNQSNTSTAIYGLSTNSISPLQLYILAADSQYNTASAQAFMQALYPPSTSNNGTDPSSTLANGSYVEFPMGGYQYTWVHAADDNDPESVFVDGTDNCRNFASAAIDYFSTEAFQQATDSHSRVYSSVGDVLGNQDFPSDQYQYGNAYEVYDYLSYMNTHDTNINALLTNGTSIPQGDFDQIRFYSDQSQWSFYGNPDNRSSSSSDPTSINTIAGQTFAYALMDRLTHNVQTVGQQAKLSLLFGEFPAFLSFASLADLPATNGDFLGMPEFGSSMVFELFTNSPAPSTTANTSLQYPSESDLKIRFLFRNGSDADFTAYPLFGTGDVSLSWSRFQNHLNNFALGSLGDWCDRCDAWIQTAFCLTFNSTAWSAALDAKNSSGSGGNFQGQMSPTLAGVIGVVCTLAVLALILVVGVGLFGLRFRRTVPRRNVKQGLGGFKGGQKLASDPDVNIIKDKSGAGITAEKRGESSASGGGHERVGSWELKDANVTRPKSLTRQSEEGGGEGADRFGFAALGKEVKPDERV